MEYVKPKKRNVFKMGILDENDKPKKDKNGHEIFIEFDLEDITIPDKYSKSVYLIEKAEEKLKNDLSIINKKPDTKGKGLMSKNEKAKYDALKGYYKSIEEAMDLFLGKDGTKKIFGDNRYLTMFEDLSEMLKPIMPKLKINFEIIEEQIKKKYSQTDSGVLKDE